MAQGLSALPGIVFPRQGPIDTLSQGIDGFMKQTFSPSLRFLPIPGILFDVGVFCMTPRKGIFQHYAPIMARNTFM
jgi:hypothetical protein